MKNQQKGKQGRPEDPSEGPLRPPAIPLGAAGTGEFREFSICREIGGGYTVVDTGSAGGIDLELSAEAFTIPGTIQAGLWPSGGLEIGATAPRVGSIGQERDAEAIFFGGLKDFIRREHAETRQVVHQEAESVTRKLTDYVKANPSATLSLFAKWMLVFAIFSLAVQAVSGFAIMNSWFCALLLAVSIAVVGMCRIAQRKIGKGV